MCKRYSFLIILIALLALNCHKYDVPGVGVYGSNTFNGVVKGKVTDGAGNPIVDVKITIGIKSALTDVKGFFRINDGMLNEKETVVSAEKQGYFKTYRVFNATTSVNNIEIILVNKQLAGTITNSSGGIISLSNGTKIGFPANGVALESGGGVYNGDVNVYAAYIDPTRPDISKTIPGSFLAKDKNGNKVVLASYGMLAVELESPSGEKLQIAKSKSATLTTAIPSAVQSSAPATISMWYVDEVTGIWQEEGTAIKNGDKYVGAVSHFTTWNCDTPLVAGVLSATFIDQFGGPLSYNYVRISVVGEQTTVWGFTDSLGQVNLYYPMNKPLLIEALNVCGNVIYSENFGPFSGDINLGTIAANNPVIATVQGKLIKCSGQKVTNGYAIINYGNKSQTAQVNSNGEFSLGLSECVTPVPTICTVIAVDEEDSRQSLPQSFTIVSPITNTGNIAACGDTTFQFISYNNTVLNDQWPFIRFEGDIFNADFAGVSGIASLADGLTLVFQLNPTGIYPVTYMRLEREFAHYTIVPPFNVTLSRFPNQIGEFFEGTYSGKYIEETYNPNIVESINGAFRIRRTR
ncbi:MAG TPA: hypothetical protein PKW62_01300 [Chitinophagaceae bacterium]|nr:hypothetical protein [Chitinophagaceae bacterium]